MVFSHFLELRVLISCWLQLLFQKRFVISDTFINWNLSNYDFLALHLNRPLHQKTTRTTFLHLTLKVLPTNTHVHLSTLYSSSNELNHVLDFVGKDRSAPASADPFRPIDEDEW